MLVYFIQVSIIKACLAEKMSHHHIMAKGGKFRITAEVNYDQKLILSFTKIKCINIFS